jgi:hypothetical protein
MSTDIDRQVTEFTDRWLAAERKGDTGTLDGLAAAGFTLVGPLGFVLDKRQWLARYSSGAMVTHEIGYEDVTVREYGDTAVAVGVLTQRAAYQGNPSDGRFRVTQITVRDGDRRLLAGLHYSPIAAPPAR